MGRIAKSIFWVSLFTTTLFLSGCSETAMSSTTVEVKSNDNVASVCLPKFRMNFCDSGIEKGDYFKQYQTFENDVTTDIIIARKGDLYYSFLNGLVYGAGTNPDGTTYDIYFVDLLVSHGDKAWRYYFIDDIKKLPATMKKFLYITGSCYDTSPKEYGYPMTWDEAPPCAFVMNQLVLDAEKIYHKAKPAITKSKPKAPKDSCR